jgi:DNA-binding response OmpR family regulator
MKKILIIEDDEVVANVYCNRLMAEGYRVQRTSHGETGLKVMRLFKPDAIILDLMLPGMSGIEVIQQVRADKDCAAIPIIVFSNTYLTELIQEAWKAGANKWISKANCSLKEVLDVVRHTVRKSGSAPEKVESEADLQARLRMKFVEGLPATLATLRGLVKTLIKAGNETERREAIHQLHLQIHALNGNAGVSGLKLIGQLTSALEALLRTIEEKPEHINASTLRTTAAGVDFIGFLFERGLLPENQTLPGARILVVDDDTISRRAILKALEQAELPSLDVESSEAAYDLLAAGPFDLVFLDVDMPGMNGFELCTKLRSLPMHQKTPVVFVTGLNDFDNRTQSTMVGGNDFIAKPFLFIELTVKALIHVLRGKLQPAK